MGIEASVLGLVVVILIKDIIVRFTGVSIITERATIGGVRWRNNCRNPDGQPDS
jgi:hypothetical protein